MSVLTGRAEEYLRIRRMLGHELAEAARLLPRFVAYLDYTGAEVITVEAALAWAQQPQGRPGGKVHARRMTVARGFARHMAGIDPRTQVPPLGLLPYRQQWRPPFIYSDSDIQALIAEVPRIVCSQLRVATYQTLIGLLAATGMRVGEALRLQRSQVDWAEGVLTVHATKFGKSREVPLSPSTVRRLRPGPRSAVASAQDARVLRVHGRDAGGLLAFRGGVPPRRPGQRRRSRLPGPPPRSRHAPLLRGAHTGQLVPGG